MAEALRGYEPLTLATLPNFLATLPVAREQLGGAPQQWRAREVGDGNLNLVFLVDGPDGGVCVKQSLPYVRALATWHVSVERAFFEQAYFAAVAPHVARLIPRVYHFEPQLFCIVMEQLRPHVVLRRGLIGGTLYPRVARDVAHFIAHAAFFSSNLGASLEAKMDGVALFAKNHALVRISSDLIFTDPYRVNERNRWTSPQLDDIAAAVRADARLKVAAARLGQRFLSDAQALIHGDLHTGSVMVTPDDTRIIDPEFAFYGPIGMDLGAFVANLLMSYFSQPGHAAEPGARAEYAHWVLAQIAVFWNHFRATFLELWQTQGAGDAYAPSMFADGPSRTALARERESFLDRIFDDMLGFAAVKMIRRILGFAHNIDFDYIADPDVRAAGEAASVDVARTLLLFPDRVRSCDALLELARRSVRAPQPAGARLQLGAPR